MTLPPGTGKPNDAGSGTPGRLQRTPDEGRRRVVIESVAPQVEGGAYPAKRTIGEDVRVEADIYCDGHDSVVALLLYRHDEEDAWSEEPMTPLLNDRWRASFPVNRRGIYWFRLVAWVDEFTSWQRDLAKKADAGTADELDYEAGAVLLEDRMSRARGPDAKKLGRIAKTLRSPTAAQPRRLEAALDPEATFIAQSYADRSLATRTETELPVMVDRERARFSSWYELFPRSTASEPGAHGTFADCRRWLDDISGMGFDVVYFPPIHPISTVNRKGKNNANTAEPGDPGSPWAIGSPEGGHDTIHPELGTLEDFRSVVGRARELDMEIALDLAFQCAPDHPYVQDHPEWFKHRPDGSIQFAENPPKKYEDIYPFDFESHAWFALWEELLRIVLFWVEQGVSIFRVDNPHTKPFAFWEWLISEVKGRHPEVLFLSEAFTRPKVMYRLAKLGFTQSYTYFAWRNTRQELETYFTELTQTEVSEYFRPNLWPNTPDILTEFLQHGGRPAFTLRLILAATLGASYGIYGPPFEIMEHHPREPGSEEYLNSEKYQVRHWDIEGRPNLRELITLVNRIRRENPALQSDRHLVFHPTDNEELLCYSKHSPDMENVVLVVVNLNPYHAHSGWVQLDLGTLEIEEDRSFQVHDLLSGARYMWTGRHNFVHLDPAVSPAHIFRVRRHLRTEQDFTYFM